MSDEKPLPSTSLRWSRRDLLVTGAALTLPVDGQPAGASPTPASGAKPPRALPNGPFDTLRDYIAALEARGLLLRVEKVDQDSYEGTGLMYRLTDQWGAWGAPAVLFENLRINGQWHRGPLLANDQGPWEAEAIVYGIEPVAGDGWASYRQAKMHFLDLLSRNGGSFPTLPPAEVPRERALCKQVVLRGNDIDLTTFAFIQNNPADAGRYINTGSVFTADPQMGTNFGTYRCQLRGPRTIGVNSEPNQTGWKMLMAAKARGEKVARASIALGCDPIVWMISSSRVANRRGDAPVDELALAGGLRGRPLEVVRSETNELLVPAHAEMIIEGEIPLDDFQPEGPYGEVMGYLGLRKTENFWMNVMAVTHRRDPWLVNNFTGVNRGAVKAAAAALSIIGLRRMVPELVDYHTSNNATGIGFVSIDKTSTGQGLSAGRRIIERIPTLKILIVVDKDMDVLDPEEMLLALGSRWQPHPASHIYDELPGMPLDPSSPKRPLTSKIVIDATRQLPDEGGPAVFPGLNRTLLEEGAPGVFARVDAKWGALLKSARWSRSPGA